MVKTRAGLVRTEVERSIDAAELTASGHTADRRPPPTRVTASGVGDFAMEIDRFHEVDTVLAEVGFLGDDGRRSCRGWRRSSFARVTDEPEYRNSQIAADC